MIVKIDKKFQKDFNKVKNEFLKKQLIKIIRELEFHNSLSEIPHLKKLKGFDRYFRIKQKDFRIGLEFIRPNTLVLIRYLHRKDIYDKWPTN